MNEAIEDIAARIVAAVSGSAAGTDGELVPYTDPLTVPPVIRPGRDERQVIGIALRPTWVRMHSQLPPTLMWGYGGSVPGPTIEVRRGQRVRVDWTNRVPPASPHPVTAVAVEREPGQADPHNRPGRQGAEPDGDVAALPARSVTGLHGAPAGGGDDIRPDDAVEYGGTQRAEYPNDHRAVQWWYRDHARGISRWNAYAGLVGTYLVRDDEEDALGLPSGEREVPLILADRNLDREDEAAGGRLSGRLLHKTTLVTREHPETGRPVTLPFLGPYTTVNGTIWPYLDVVDGWYRFRMVNASNARVYDLVLVDDEDNPVPGVVHLIGGDGGLLPRPVPVDFGFGAPLTIAPAERLDLLLDFRALAGRRVRLVNKAAGQAPGVPDAAWDVPYPQVMEFRVARGEGTDAFALPALLSRSCRRSEPEDRGFRRRLVVLTPPTTAGGGGRPELWEMEELDDARARPPAPGVVQVRGPDGTVRTYRRTARGTGDGPGFAVREGTDEEWSLLNLGAPLCPVHIPLADCRVAGREAYAVDGFDPALGGTRAPVAYDGGRRIPVPPGEQGWKDVFRVAGGEMVRVRGRFAGAYGRFAYRCTVLEHADAGMERPFVVLPGDVPGFTGGE
ncbi:multicopper oxidase family protein [Streptomyces sp. NPDC013953]|uniref:multicopper oxidase family protein n=1 Tax=Streptomyces sp. NPDC013953 TaxID=3364868 RepID=UPI0036F70547